MCQLRAGSWRRGRKVRVFCRLLKRGFDEGKVEAYYATSVASRKPWWCGSAVSFVCDRACRAQLLNFWSRFQQTRSTYSELDVHVIHYIHTYSSTVRTYIHTRVRTCACRTNQRCVFVVPGNLMEVCETIPDPLPLLFFTATSLFPNQQRQSSCWALFSSRALPPSRRRRHCSTTVRGLLTLCTSSRPRISMARTSI